MFVEGRISKILLVLLMLLRLAMLIKSFPVSEELKAGFTLEFTPTCFRYVTQSQLSLFLKSISLRDYLSRIERRFGTLSLLLHPLALLGN